MSVRERLMEREREVYKHINECETRIEGSNQQSMATVANKIK